MARPGLLPALGGWLRRYLVALLLVGGLLLSFVKVVTIGTGPMPQHPPEGYELQQDRAQLQWSKGTRAVPIQLEVAMDDPGFTELVVDKAVTGSSHSMNRLEPGHTYYWRLRQGDDLSPVATFKTSIHNVRF